MTAVAFTVNGKPLEIAIAPRVSLADALRETCGLTGTHLGCEHGVCGACTVLIDDQPARACITLAVACAGARVTTIEGLDDDAVMTALRGAFSRHHALQCGYCTPGMLISARDLVARLAEPDEKAIRLGLSGNLCRCTGYVGIVNAVKEVIAARVEPSVVGGGRASLGPVGAHAVSADVVEAATIRVTPEAEAALAAPADFVPAHSFAHQFALAQPPERVFALFADVRAVALAIPGITLTAASDDHAEGAFVVRLGPMTARFKGQAEIAREPATMSGRILAAGGDGASASRARGMVSYRVRGAEQGAVVDLEIGYALTGLLAQLGRPGLVEAVARGLISKFAENLEREMKGRPANAPRGWLSWLRGR